MIDNKSKKSLKAAIWYIISNFISKALIYICTPLYTRMLSTAEYGEYSNFISWQNILVTILTFDLSAAVGIAYYDYKSDKEFDGFINTISVFSYLIPGFFCLIIFLFDDYFSNLFSIKKEYFIILLGFIMFNNTINIFQAEQRVRLKYKLSTIITLGTSIFTVVSTLMFVLVFQDNLFGVLLGGVLINIIVSFFLAIKIWLRNKTIRWDYLNYALRVAIPLVPHVLAGAILGSSDKVMITKYCGEEMTALYGLAYTISLVITMVSSSINKAWTPWFFDRLINNNKYQIKKVSNMIVLIIAFFSFSVCLLAPEILLIVGGKSYLMSSALIPPVIIACLCNCVSTFYVNIEFYNKKTAGISVATVTSASLNIIMNYVFITKFGYIAAAYTTLASSAISLLFHLHKVRKQGMWDVFDNKFLLVTLLLYTIISEGMLICYDKCIIRYGIFALCLIFAITIVKKKKEQILFVINNLKSENIFGEE